MKPLLFLRSRRFHFRLLGRLALREAHGFLQLDVRPPFLPRGGESCMRHLYADRLFSHTRSHTSCLPYTKQNGTGTAEDLLWVGWNANLDDEQIRSTAQVIPTPVFAGGVSLSLARASTWQLTIEALTPRLPTCIVSRLAKICCQNTRTVPCAHLFAGIWHVSLITVRVPLPYIIRECCQAPRHLSST